MVIRDNFGNKMGIQIVLLILGFTVLIKGADWLVNGSVSMAKKYNVSELVIGLTIVAFGTSAPELVVSIISSMKGFTDVTLGNAVGSNLFNLMFILGISGIIYPLVVKLETVWKEIPFSMIAALLLILMANNFFIPSEKFMISRLDGVILLLFFLGFMIYIFKQMKSTQEELEAGYKMLRPAVSIVLLVAGLVSLIIGSRLVVDNAVKIAQVLGASEKLIGVTIVSAGTSLPELVTSVVAATKKKTDIAIGNIIGSNIFNIFLILGVSSVIAPIPFNTSFNFDIALLIISTSLLFIFMFSGVKYKLDRWEAAILLLGYFGYVVYLLY